MSQEVLVLISFILNWFGEVFLPPIIVSFQLKYLFVMIIYDVICYYFIIVMFQNRGAIIQARQAVE